MQLRSLSRVASPILTTIFLFTTIFSGAFSVYADTETTYFYLHDHLGSVDTVLDDEGNVVEKRDYLPFGEERLQIIEDTQHPELYESETYGYTDKELDDETGLMYYGARYYDPLIGRFTTVDPLILDEAQKSEENLQSILHNPQMLNAYSYALNNPVLFVDLFGESPYTDKWKRAGSFVDGLVNIVAGTKLSVIAGANTIKATFGVVTAGKGVFQAGKTVLEEVGNTEIEYDPLTKGVGGAVDTVVSSAYKPNDLFGKAVKYAQKVPGYEEGFEAVGEMIENKVTTKEIYKSTKVEIPRLINDMVTSYNENINSLLIKGYNKLVDYTSKDDSLSSNNLPKDDED